MTRREVLGNAWKAAALGMVCLAGCDGASNEVQHSEVSPERKAELDKQNEATRAAMEKQSKKK